MYFGEYPFDVPYVYSRGLYTNSNNFSGSYCKSQDSSEFMSLAYKNNEGISEQNACKQYIAKWKQNNPEKKVLRIAYKNAIGGQTMLKTYLDLLIIAKDDQHLYYYVFEYAGMCVYEY